MWCNQIFALISANEAGRVENLIVCDNIEWANQTAKQLYGNTALALDTTWYPLKIGDHYIDGRFYSSDDGSEIKKNLTEEERIALLQEETIFLKEQQAEQDEIILETNYALLLMQESITDIV